MARRFPMALLFSILGAPLPAQESPHPTDTADDFGPTEQRVLARLTAVKKAGTLVVHYEPTVWMKAVLPEFVRSQSKALEAMEARLGMKYDGEIHVFVYLDAAEMARRTGAPDGIGAFSDRSFIHTPFTVPAHHELTHVLCLQWNRDGNHPVPHDPASANYDLPEYKFVAEGFADAMTLIGHDQIPMRHWVSFYRALGWVPPLERVRAEFPRTDTPAPGYWIAGSFLEYLIELHGMEKVKRFYFRPQDARELFGSDVPDLEERWLSWLDETPPDFEKIARAYSPDVVVFEKRLREGRGRANLRITADNLFLLFLNDRLVGSGDSWERPREFSVEQTGDDRLRVLVINQGGPGGLLLDLLDPEKALPLTVSDRSWNARRAEGVPQAAEVLCGPCEGLWNQVATPAQREVLRSFRGSWIWTR